VTLRVGFDARDANDPSTGGWGRYARFLLGALRDQAGTDVELVTYDSGPSGVPELLFEQGMLPRLARRDALDVLHAPNCFLPARRPCAGVVTVHDLAFEAYPGDFGRLTGWKYRRYTRAGVASAERVIVPSESTKSDLVARYETDPSKIRVIPEASALPMAPAGGSRPTDPFVLCVSAIRAKKNIARLVEAFAEARNRGLKQRLVIAGPGDPGGLESDGVEFHGPAGEQELDRLYRAADFLVYPSLYEGFGLVTLEAMERGCPVALARATSLPEVGGEAAEYFDPLDPGEMADLLLRLGGDAALRSRLTEAGLQRAAGFTWERAARETLDVYREAAALGGPRT